MCPLRMPVFQAVTQTENSSDLAFYVPPFFYALSPDGGRRQTSKPLGKQVCRRFSFAVSSPCKSRCPVFAAIALRSSAAPPVLTHGARVGHCSRRLETRAGTLILKIPQDRRGTSERNCPSAVGAEKRLCSPHGQVNEEERQRYDVGVCLGFPQTPRFF